MFKKISWIVVALVVSLAMVFISCEGEKEIENRKLVDVFDLNAHLAEMGYTTATVLTEAVFKEDTMITNAGDLTQFNVIDAGDGKLGLKINTKGHDWGSGLDLPYSSFRWYGGPDYKGDEITIKGKVLSGTKWMLDTKVGGAEAALGGQKLGVDADGAIDGDGTFEYTFTLTAAEAVTIKGASPPAVRLNCKTVNVEIEIYSLTVKGYRPTVVPFDPVTGITGVPTSAFINQEIELTGIIAPSYATNQEIVWSLKSAGTTGAVLTPTVIEGEEEDDPDTTVYTLKATAVGSVVVTATIINGKTKTTNYVQDFTITIMPPVKITVGVGGTPQTDIEVKLVNASFMTGAPTGGYKYKTTAGYSAFSYFTVDLGTETVGNIASVKATFLLAGDDNAYKNVAVAAAATDAVPTYKGSPAGGNNWTNQTEATADFTFTNTFTGSEALTGEVYIIIWDHANAGQEFTISDIVITFN
jgi:hypothetical protein